MRGDEDGDGYKDVDGISCCDCERDGGVQPQPSAGLQARTKIRRLEEFFS
jgi:hypothetical protein